MTVIETDRLELRPWRVSDAEALYKYASDPRVSELAMWPCHTSVEMSRWVIENIFIPNPHSYAIVLKQSGEAIGAIGLVPSGEENFPPLPGEREVGYWIGLPHWNRGLTTEALRAFINYCRNDLRLNSLLLTTDPANLPSQRVARKTGFSPLTPTTTLTPLRLPLTATHPAK